MKQHTPPPNSLCIQGSARIHGFLAISGAKNDALEAIASTLLTDEKIVLQNMPRIADVDHMLSLIEKLGKKYRWISNHIVEIFGTVQGTRIDHHIAQQLRASVLLTGPILARISKVSFPHPGGCVIGQRPLDLFLEGYAAFGARTIKRSNSYHIRAPKLRGDQFTFPKISVTGTGALMMTASLAHGVTRLINAACEPEIVSLALNLNRRGAKISGAGTPFITIRGIKSLRGGTHTIIPDRVEAGSFALLAAAARGKLTLSRCIPEHLSVLWNLLRKAGVRISTTRTSVTVNATRTKLRATGELKTHEYPGFITDLQAPFVVFATQTRGKTLVYETIFDGRLFWTSELARMGADILLSDAHHVLISGPTPLRGREIEAPDLRAGLAFIIAGSIAQGSTIVRNAQQIDRGYENIVKKLSRIGVSITRA